jgi:hypothetical protein
MRRGIIIISMALAGCGGGGGSGGSASTVAPATSGTTAGTTSSVPVPATPPAPPPAAQPPVGQWWKGDLHSHSAPYSQDADSQGGDRPGMCFFLAETAGLDYLALTDHRTMDQVNDPTYNNHSAALTVLDGEEWGGPIHIGMVGLARQVPELSGPASTLNARVQSAYDDAHRQGGAVILNHPCQEGSENIYQAREFDAVEVWNTFWNSLPKGITDITPASIDRKLAGEGLAALGIDCNPELREAARHRGGGGNHQALKLWEAYLNGGQKKAIVGGGDRHMLVMPGMPTTRIFAPTQSKADLIAGLRRARTWVGSEGGPEVELTADADGDGIYEAIIGDSVPLNRPVHFRARIKNGLGGELEVVKNGATYLRYVILTNDDTYDWTQTDAVRTWTRIDVYEKVDLQFQHTNFQLLALGGTIFGQTGFQALATLSLPAGFQVSLGTRIPTIRLPHEVLTILNADRLRWGWARGAITSPIWSE